MNEHLMTAMDQFLPFAQTMTGFKKTLTDQGWSEEAAEQLVIHMIKNANKGGSE